MTEIEYHERLYSGFAQSHFAKPAVRALRRHIVSRILRVTGAGQGSRVLSLGCGIGDTELPLAPRVAEIVGLDASPAAIRQARLDAERASIQNARFIEGTLEATTLEPGSFDVVMAVFFIHHLLEPELMDLTRRVRTLLRKGGIFYSLDPSRYRLTGAIGSLLIPKLMARYQSPNERQLAPAKTAELFRQAGFDARFSYYDFVSTPLAGLFPAWSGGYRASRALDELLIRTPLLKRLSSNFEVIAVNAC